jgi:hypothetical protein
MNTFVTICVVVAVLFVSCVVIGYIAELVRHFVGKDRWA